MHYIICSRVRLQACLPMLSLRGLPPRMLLAQTAINSYCPYNAPLMHSTDDAITEV